MVEDDPFAVAWYFEKFFGLDFIDWWEVLRGDPIGTT
jgi:hypothetical protein